MLPADQGEALRAVWEFEAADTADARFAKAHDRLQPTLLNHVVGGGTWTDYDVDETRLQRIADGSPVWAAVEAVFRGCRQQWPAATAACAGKPGTMTRGSALWAEDYLDLGSASDDQSLPCSSQAMPIAPIERPWRSETSTPPQHLPLSYPGPEKLDQIEPIAERIRHIRHPSVFAYLYVAIERCTKFGQAGDHCIEIANDEIQMHRSPMPGVVSLDTGGPRSAIFRSVGQEENGKVCPFEFYPTWAQVTHYRKSDTTVVKFYAASAQMQTYYSPPARLTVQTPSARGESNDCI